MTESQPQSPQNTPPEGGGDKTFTQADLDRIIADRLARERRNFQDYDDLKAKASKYDELEASKKTEADQLKDQLQAAQSEGTQSKAAQMRLEVALDKAPEGLPLAQLRKLAKRLQGSTKEELEADATELFEDYAPKTDDTGNGARRRPQEDLRPGAVPSAEPEKSPDQIADEVLKSGF